MFTTVEYKDINTLYSSNSSQRYQKIVDSFITLYGNKPDFIARAPGRINVIGEHIDYEGYGVLPAAIQKDCLIAVSSSKTSQITLNHVQSNVYPSTVIAAHPEEKVDFADNYVKYFRAGYRAGIKGLDPQKLVGLNILIEGNVPKAAGVSSSSALCVCTALAALHANGGEIDLKKEDFIERVIKGQRQTGTASGGMDQSISVMGKTNFSLYIQFDPIKCTPVHLPEGFRFVVMNTLVESAKLQTAVFRYNKRVCECRLALAILVTKLHMPPQHHTKGYKILKEIEDWSGLPLNTLSSLVDTFIDRKDYSLEEIQHIIAPIKVNDLLADVPLYQKVIQANKFYKLNEAARHVFDEAYRVLNFIDVCKSNLQGKDKLVLLGKLMNESQFSCKNLYQCSCDEIDQITELAKLNGAYGSRLTGAGWGGCTVSLVDANKSQQFMSRMISDYYNKKPAMKQKIEAIGISNIVFETIPSQGACIITL